MALSPSPGTWSLIVFIKIYQYSINPFIRNHCRFQPTCSQYGIQALYKFGMLKGSWLIMKRLLKCQPIHPGGYDPLPINFFWIFREYQ
ncbi:membrane protein insertion efficiency factor YidD [Candidatus Ishikawella capsulata]|uniref:Putative membrane protein insertion efficiency factor n=1 Tax=Candidatus Ishikawaella capsulata Mpkobe TaxID=476281 RepID=C5WC29_9ENTR|nr:membrane protein insertion efficiency factor YidD [Candidatus Ishikawaella capsulata]BAH82885.1 hypothetical protein ICMP_012 [Candidatus Ishikawaella capsulata Mpkobe]